MAIFADNDTVLFKRLYSEDFKQKVCKVYLESKKTKDAIRKEFGIKSKSALVSWLREYGYIDPKVNPVKELPIMAKPKKETTKSLEKENEDLKLQLEMYKRMIEIAEKEFKIPIVKKSGTK